MQRKTIGVLFAWIVVVCTQGQAQNASGPVALAMVETGPYSILERSNWRRYNNGRYVGLVYQEVRASILPQPAQSGNGALVYQGNFFVLERTLRDMRHSAQMVDAAIPVRFELLKNGEVSIENDQGFPRLRGFPAFPAREVVRGATWQAPGTRAVDPLNSGQPLFIPFVAEYEYRGTEEYRGEWVHRIHAAYASRYRSNGPSEEGISRVAGNHKVTILIRVADGLPVYMHDDLDVTYFLADGSSVQFKGFTLTFGAGIVPMNRGTVIASLGEGGKFEHSGIDLQTIPEGIRLTVRDIRFAPDSAEFLPSETPRLDLIADALRQIPQRTFLVEGHTAAIGRPAGEMELSIGRAKRMVDELVKRGISADRFIYKGWGGTKPVGDNATDAGRSANRRVEITILE